jgi:hypothetical protein
MPKEHLSACIYACNLCAHACDYAAAACLNEKNPGWLTRCIALTLDCAAMCRITATYMARDSELTDRVLSLCAEVCEVCAEECERHDFDHCRKCARACRRCAEEFRRIGPAPGTVRSM